MFGFRYGYGFRSRRRSSFAPDALFANGEAGFWFDPSDLSTMWQDTAATIPAVVGGLVARIDDRSGNGFNYSQATESKRPTLREDGEVRYLEFDGVADAMLLSGAVKASASPWSAIIGGRSAPTALQYFTDAATGRLIFAAVADVAGNVGFFDGTWKKGANEPNTDYVYTWLLDNAGATSGIVRTNGVERLRTTYAAKAMAGSTSLAAANTGGGNYVGGRVYGYVLIDRVLTANEIASVEAYMAQRVGVTLP